MKKVLALCLACLLLIAPAAAQEAQTAYTPEELLAIWYQIGDMLRANGNYPFEVLQRGDQGPEVRMLQLRLAELYYYSGALDSNFGSKTFAALRKFESVNGLTRDGIASVEDQIALFSLDALTLGDTEAAPERTPPPAATPGPTPTPVPPDDDTPDDGDSGGGINPGLFPGGFRTLPPGVLDNIGATPEPTLIPGLGDILDNLGPIGPIGPIGP